MQSVRLNRFAHPSLYSLSHALLKGEAEGAVTAVAAVAGQLLGSEGLLGLDGIAVVADKVIDAEVIDIGIVCDALMGEIAAEVEAVGADSLRQLGKGQVVLEVELRLDAVALQQRPDGIVTSHLRGFIVFHVIR